MTGPEIPLHDNMPFAGQKLTGDILTPPPQLHPWSHLFFSVFHSLDSNAHPNVTIVTPDPPN